MEEKSGMDLEMEMEPGQQSEQDEYTKGERRYVAVTTSVATPCQI